MCEKWVAIFKVKVTVTEFGFIAVMKSWLFLVFLMFWTAHLVVTNLIWQWMFISWSVLWKGASSPARVLFRNIILLCSRSKPQSFLLDLQKYWNFYNPKQYHGTPSQDREKIFLLLHKAGDREYGLGDWIRLLPLLANPISKADI